MAFQVSSGTCSPDLSSSVPTALGWHCAGHTCSRMGLPMPIRPPSARAAPRVHPSRPLPMRSFSSGMDSPSCNKLMM